MRVELLVFHYPRCREDVDKRVSHTPKNYNRPFYVCSEKGVKCFFLWIDVLAKKLMHELLEEHKEWLPILPRTAAAAERAPKEETEGEACNDREVAVELRRLNTKIRKLEDQAQIPICNYIWAFVGKGVHLVSSGEDAVDIGEDVVQSEEDGLIAALKHFTEELAHVERVSEGHCEQIEGVGMVTNIVEGKHPRLAPWEVGKAGSEEVAGELDRPPPPGLHPHMEHAIQKDAQRVAQLLHDTRRSKVGPL
ncbi:hypothetical protein D1007_49286 [Hordeum vulgare]|nr:hypothetical protein D1007_49286 [Hordeum vulgare]